MAQFGRVLISKKRYKVRILKTEKKKIKCLFVLGKESPIFRNESSICGGKANVQRCIWKPSSTLGYDPTFFLSNLILS